MTRAEFLDLAPLVVSVVALAVSIAVAVLGRRSDRQDRRNAIVIEEAAKVIAYEHAFRIFIKRQRGPERSRYPDLDDDGSLVPYSSTKRLSETKIRLASTDRRLLASMNRLADAGRAISSSADAYDSPAMVQLRDLHTAAIDDFSRQTVRVVGI